MYQMGRKQLAHGIQKEPAMAKQNRKQKNTTKYMPAPFGTRQPEAGPGIDRPAQGNGGRPEKGLYAMGLADDVMGRAEPECMKLLMR